MNGFRALSMFAICGLALVSAAHATPIVAGETVVAAPISFGGSLLASTSFTSAGPVIFGSYATEVYRDPLNVYCAGCLDFVYMVADAAGPSITNLFVASFRDFPLDVGFVAVAGGVPPTTIERDPDGNAIRFDFATALSPGSNETGIDPGRVSDPLVIQTPAMSFGAGSAVLVASNFATGGSAFEPTPEPESLVLLSTGMLGLAGFVRARFRANKV